MIRRSEFIPARWLENPHAQTLYAAVLRRRPYVEVRRERLELPDGDFADVDWCGPDTGPIVIVLHGLEGSIESHYAAGIMKVIAENRWRGALLHFRGCSGVPNRLPVTYHSGFTRDFDYFVNLLQKQESGTPLAAVGYSLGGNVLLKWLGETGTTNGLTTAVAVSVPFDLAIGAEHINHGISQIYKWSLLGRMRKSVKKKFRTVPPPFPPPNFRRLRSFRDFDNAITAPLHNYTDADDYYAQASSRQYLRGIRLPTLILHSSDDPFMTSRSVPAESELSDSVTLELSTRGGHVGFVGGSLLRPEYWLEKRIKAHLINAFNVPKARPWTAMQQVPIA